MARLLHALRPDGSIDAAAIREASGLLRAGRLVAFPTETVYGLGAHALDPTAVAAIFEAKGRPRFNPLIVHVSGADQARALASRWPETAARLAAAFWPGPLTLVVPRADAVPDETTAGLDTVALRAPAHPVARALLEEAGIPVAAPSANRFGSVSPTSAAHVLSQLGDRIEAILDGGPCAVGIESTVLDTTGARPRLLRPGGVSAEAIERVVGPPERPHLVLDEGSRASPGLTSRHYAPDACVKRFTAPGLARILAGLPAEARVGGLAWRTPAPADARIAAWEMPGADAASFARGMYGALHRLEAAGVTHVLLEEVPSDPAWEAIADRLRRAAGSPA